jgi:hypothetical protein
MACPQVANGGERLQIWRVAVNILSKQLQTANKEQSSSLRIGHEANNYHHKKSACYKILVKERGRCIPNFGWKA